VLVVLARDGDVVADRLAGICEPGEVVTLRPADLACIGWCESVGENALSPSTATAVIAGRKVPRERIRGVLTRLPEIAERDVRHVARADRPYVAAEMTAFLIGWLSNLACPVINRPTPQCLWGPVWSPERWAMTAVDSGLRARPVHRHVVFPPPVRADSMLEETLAMTVIGDRCFGSFDAALHLGARRLARAADVDVLTLQFDPSGALVSAYPWLDDPSDEVLHALRERLRG
jgi:hypothetical protein